MGIILTSFIILKNGLEIFPQKINEIIIFYESPYFFKIDQKEEIDLGLTVSKCKELKEFKTEIKDFNIKLKKNIRKYEYDIINLVLGYYLPETLTYSSIKIFVPEKKLKFILDILNSYEFNTIKTSYILDIKLIQGFFSTTDSIKYYINIPPDINLDSYIHFRIFMRYLENEGVKVKYSKFGKKIPFFISVSNKTEVLDILKKEIDREKFENAKKDFYLEYIKIKNDEVLLNLFLSISGLNRWYFLTYWEKILKEIKLEDIEELKIKYLTGGIFCD